MQTRTAPPDRTADPASLRAAPAQRFHRFAPRPLSYRDPRSASVLPPFARARRFLEHVATLDELGWDSLQQRIASSAELDESRARHLQSMFVTSARQAARDALMREAVRVCEHAVTLERVDAFRTTSLSTRVACAALALSLRDLLPPELFELIYGPFSADLVAHELP